MQSKGAIKFVTILLVLACLYQLSFTWVTSRVENQAKEKTTVVENGITKIDEKALTNYLDSMSTVRVYPFGLFNYRECKEKELLLGLDLKGGMNVMLQISVVDMVKAMSGNSTDPDFLKVLETAKKNQLKSGKDFLTLFAEAWEQLLPNRKMSSVFGTYEQRDKINSGTTNSEVIDVLRKSTESAISNSFNVLRNRIDRFGVMSPSIQRIGKTGRIYIELPGVKEPERVRKLLQGTASLEFWETFDCPSEGVTNYIVSADSKIRELNSAAKALGTENKKEETTVSDTTKKTDDLKSETGTVNAETESLIREMSKSDSTHVDENIKEQHPLLSLLSLNLDRNGTPMRGACVGRAHYRDTAKINQLLAMPQVLAAKPSNLRLAWTNKAIDDAGVVFELIALKLNPRFDNKAPLTGEVITDARKEFNQSSGSPYPHVSMTMNNEGTKIWAQLTKNNVGRQIAVVLDGYVYSYPNVDGEITGGRSQITGHFTTQEAEDLVNVLSSGKMPAPARIVQEAVVGPTLGKESINAGMFSFVLAFIFILVFIWIFYNTAGLAANVALILNVLFIFGVLASFGAVLTMPGIAGIVLTLGMAVDANIIIYERIKEEIAAGKTLRLAVSDGYKNAYSAIIDGQLTTLITGIVLLSFGSGPVKGFATTLIIGIITSLFSAIFISRLIFEWVLAKGKNIKFGFKWSLNFLKNTKINFLKLRKYTYSISGILIVLGLICILTKGFSLGVDFTGGRTYVVRFDKDVKSAEIRGNLLKEMGEASEVKQFGDANQMKITTKYKYADNSEDVDLEVEKLLYNGLKGDFEKELTFDEFISTQTNPCGIISSERVGAVIASDITRKAIWAVIIALCAIFAYIAIRFLRWEWGLGGVLALAHDSLITISMFSFGAGIFPWSMDIDQTFIAAILTIIGYSINDTVVIFDRIREYRKLYPKRNLYDNINDAINSTLTRTINTSFSTILVLLAIFFFGGDVIRGFAFAMTIGIFIGTYSSVFVAIPIAYDFIKRRENKKTKVLKPELLKK